MKPVLGLTLLWIVSIGYVFSQFTPGVLSGWDVVVRLFYFTIAYVFSLVMLGFVRSALRFRDTLRDEPLMEQPGHRRGLVRQDQLPDWMRPDHTKDHSPSSVLQVKRARK